MNIKQRMEMTLEAARIKDEWPNVLVNAKDLQALIKLVDEKQEKIYELADEIYWWEQAERNRNDEV